MELLPGGVGPRSRFFLAGFCLGSVSRVIGNLHAFSHLAKMRCILQMMFAKRPVRSLQFAKNLCKFAKGPTRSSQFAQEHRGPLQICKSSLQIPKTLWDLLRLIAICKDSSHIAKCLCNLQNPFADCKGPLAIPHFLKFLIRPHPTLRQCHCARDGPPGAETWEGNPFGGLRVGGFQKSFLINCVSLSARGRWIVSHFGRPGEELPIIRSKQR